MSIQIDKAVFDGDISDSLPLSVYGDLMNAELSPIFQCGFEYTVDNTELNINEVTGGGTVTQSEAMAVVATSTITGSSACLMSKRLAKDRSGFGSEVRFSTLYDPPVAGTEQYIGVAHPNGDTATFFDGLTVGYEGLTFGFQRFTDDVLTNIPQSAWDDPLGLDGVFGASGILLDHTKLNNWRIEFQGILVLSFKDPKTGRYIRVHSIAYDNANIVPSSFNPNYHFVVWATNKATTANITVKCGSYGFFVQGRVEPTQTQQPTFTTGRIITPGVTAAVALFSIRCKTQYAGRDNFIEMLLMLAQASIEANSTNNQALVFFQKNAIITGAVWNDINTTDSVAEIDLVGTITIPSGKTITGMPLAGKNDINKLNRQDFGDQILLHGESITVVGDSVNSATINAGLFWKDLF